MLLGSGSNAFGVWKQCFWGLRAMLLEAESYTLEVVGLCFRPYGAML